MKEKIESLLSQALSACQEKNILPAGELPPILLERPKSKDHGDWAYNGALVMAKLAKCAPTQLADNIVAHLPNDDLIAKVNIAGPGFINITLSQAANYGVINTILSEQAQFGCSNVLAGKKIHLEFVSANPTGPIHVGHGRSAAFGSALAKLLGTAGADVHAEYYVNDAGRQMDILATSVYLRYLEAHGASFPFPKNGYQGDYIVDIAKDISGEYSQDVEALFEGVPTDLQEDSSGDKEAHIDGLIVNAKALLGNDYAVFHQAALKSVLDGIKKDLSHFQVTYDNWFSEQSLVDSGALTKALDRLNASGATYEKGGALWFKSTTWGDEKDRVLVRDDGRPTYFASDAAYILNKFDRGFDELVYVFGADHHGYIARLKALASAFDLDPERVRILLIQFATLFREGQPVQMSTRSGEFISLSELEEEVGTDCARFFYLMRKPEQHLDFDLDLAKSQSNDNPVYYIQYAHARIASVFRQLEEQGGQYDEAMGLRALDTLSTPHEHDLIEALQTWPEGIENAAHNHAPHIITHRLRALANAFHTYYNQEQFLVPDEQLRQARLVLIYATGQVLRNGLSLLGLSAPSQM